MKLIKLLPCLVVALAVSGLGIPAQAGMVTTTQIQNPAVTALTTDVTSQRRWIESQLLQGGVAAPEAQQRVAALTDAEVAGIYQRIDEQPAGGVGILIVALIIFLVLEATGYTDVLPKK